MKRLFKYFILIHLTKWIKQGGMLLYYGRDTDPFQKVKEWWNTNGKNYAGPSAHLFQLLHIENKMMYSYGKGQIFLVKQSPKELVLTPGNDSSFINMVQQAYQKENGAGRFETKNYFYLERGPYDIASVMDESGSKGKKKRTYPKYCVRLQECMMKKKVCILIHF